MDILGIVADILLLVVLLIPVVLGIKRGFIDTALRFGKTLIALVSACIFSKGLGAWLKGKLYHPIYEKIAGFFGGETSETLSESALVEKIPEGIRQTLTSAGFDVEAMASDAAGQGANMVDAFSSSVANGAAGVLAYVISFVALFVGTLLLVILLRPLLRFVIEKTPVVKTLNKWLGALVGLLIGLVFAWILAQLLAGVLGLVAESSWTNTILLSLFYRVNPIKWIFLAAVQGIAAISAG